MKITLEFDSQQELLNWALQTCKDHGLLRAPATRTVPAPEPEPVGTPLAYLELSVRTHNILMVAGYDTVQKVHELLKHGDGPALRLDNMGRKSLVELKTQLEAHRYKCEKYGENT